MDIQKISSQDFKKFWPTFKDIIVAQETYAFAPDMSYEDAWHLWCELPEVCYVAKEQGVVLGTYYLKPNGAGPSAHICNCGYMVAPQSRGKGLAKTLCVHSQKVAVELGYKAMQFNSVVSENKIAIHIWKSLGFQIIGTIPEAYDHRKKGFVDSYIMYKKLKNQR